MTLEVVILGQDGLGAAALAELEAVGTVRMVAVSEQADLYPAIRKADAVVHVRSPARMTREVLTLCDRLRVVGLVGAGSEPVGLEAATALGITVVHAGEAGAASVADHAIGLMLAAARRVVPAHNWLVGAERKDPAAFVGVELEGKVLGLVGFGAVGRKVAQRAAGFGMTVLAHDPGVPDGEVEEAGAVPHGDLADLLAAGDFVSLHVPLTRETRHLIGETALAFMKETAFLINTSSAAVVNEEALVRALAAGEIAGAALDGFEEGLPPDSPLLRLDRLVVTPGIGRRTVEAQTRIHEIVARDVAGVLRGQAPQHALVRAGQSTGPDGSGPGGRPGGPSGETSDVLLPYNSWWGDGLPHPSHTSYRGTLPGLRDIIAAEGPITTDRLYNRYVRGAGYKRVTEPVRRRLNAGVDHLARGREIEVDEFADPLAEGGVQRVVRRTGTAAVVVRELGDRDLYQVPLNEIAELLGRRSRLFPTSSEEQLMRHVFDRYGRKSLTRKARGYLESAIRIMHGLPGSSPDQ